MKCEKWLAVVVVWFMLALGVEAGTIHVPEDVGSIQAAIKAAEDGDEILVAPGEYAESIDFLGKAIAVRSTEGYAKTTLTPAPAQVDSAEGSVVVFQNGESREAVLEGFTITGGTGSVVQEEDVQAVAGGGILVTNGSNPTILGNLIESNNVVSPTPDPNTVPAIGGGVAILMGSSPLLEENSFLGNSAEAGGGIAIVVASNPDVQNNTIIHNESGYGGGIFVAEASAPAITDNSLLENHALWGGGIYVQTWSSAAGDPPPETRLIANTILRNIADFGGGGITLFLAQALVKRCTLEHNTAPSDLFQGWAGGLYIEESTARIASCALQHNTGSYGGGMYIAGTFCEVVVENLSLCENIGMYGGGISLSEETPPHVEIYNTIFWLNQSHFDASAPNLRNGNVEYVHNCDFSDGLYEGINGNFRADPRFVNPSDGIHIEAGSPCIDAGIDRSALIDELDIDGDARVVDGDGDTEALPDVGADEYVPLDAAFIRGDANTDGAVDIADAIRVLGYLFAGGPDLLCDDAGDSNDDGGLDISDGVTILMYLFVAGGEIPPPGPESCGNDPSPDSLTCRSFPPCP